VKRPEIGWDGPRAYPSVPRILQKLPPLAGEPVRLARAHNLRDRHGPVHGGAFLRERRILFDCAPSEFRRIFVHELFHFVWLRIGNPLRVSFEGLIASEMERGAAGELGWASESRKLKLASADWRLRTRRWREYCCESFCDTAAWLYSGAARHPEFTLAISRRKRRLEWFERALGGRELSI
jgi:hypothetical protein